MPDIDSTVRESNFRDSVKKYFVDNLYRIEKVELTFDKSMTTPKVQGTLVDKWYAIMFGSFNPDTFGDAEIIIFCCAKQDSEGFKVAQLRDKVMKYLLDSTKTDGTARIPLYRSSATEAWTVIGSLMVILEEGAESPQIEAEDNTKFKTIRVRLRWAAKI